MRPVGFEAELRDRLKGKSPLSDEIPALEDAVRKFQPEDFHKKAGGQDLGVSCSECCHHQLLASSSWDHVVRRRRRRRQGWGYQRVEGQG
eukprot:987953-Karenia_brevis.AAC.1